MRSENSTNFYRKSRILVLAAGHLITDSYNGFLAPLLPVLVIKLNLSLTLAGGLASILMASSALTQPVYGYLSDKLGRRYFVILGPLVTAVFISLIGLAPSYGLLVLMLVLGGLGTASFHPQAAALVGKMSGQKKGLGMSVFVIGGCIGFSLGPLIVLPVVAHFGLGSTPLTMVFGILISVLLFKYSPPLQLLQNKLQKSRWWMSSGGWKPLNLLYLIVVIRAFVVSGFSNFIPLYLQSKKVSLFVSGVAVTIFLLSGAMGQLIGGYLSDIIGRKEIILISLVGAVPLLLAFLKLNSNIAFLFLALSGLFLFSSVPVNIVMAQEMVPNKASTVSAFMMGFGWGTGGLFITPFGALADRLGLAMALSFLATVPLIGLFCALALPKTRSTALPKS